MPAEQVLQESQGHRESAAAVILVEEDGVRDAPGIDHADERLLHVFVALYLRKSHTCLNWL